MDKKQINKKIYKKPRLRIIELAAEEVLATGCKSPGLPTTVGVGVDLCGHDACSSQAGS